FRAGCVTEATPTGPRQQPFNEHESKVVARLFVLATRIPQTDYQLHGHWSLVISHWHIADSTNSGTNDKGRMTSDYSSVLPFLMTSGSEVAAASASTAVGAAVSTRRGARTPAIT